MKRYSLMALEKLEGEAMFQGEEKMSNGRWKAFDWVVLCSGWIGVYDEVEE